MNRAIKHGKGTIVSPLFARGHSSAIYFSIQVALNLTLDLTLTIMIDIMLLAFSNAALMLCSTSAAAV